MYVCTYVNYTPWRVFNFSKAGNDNINTVFFHFIHYITRHRAFLQFSFTLIVCKLIWPKFKELTLTCVRMAKQKKEYLMINLLHVLFSIHFLMTLNTFCFVFFCLIKILCVLLTCFALFVSVLLFNAR